MKRKKTPRVLEVFCFSTNSGNKPSLGYGLVWGRPIVTGNNDTNGVTSSVTLTSPKFKFTNASRGLLNYDNGASTHIELTLNGSPLMWNRNGNAGVADTYYAPNIVPIITVFAFGNYGTGVTDPNSPILTGYTERQVALGKFVNYRSGLVHVEYPANMTHKSDGTTAQSIYP